MIDPAIRQSWDGAAIGRLVDVLARLFDSGEKAKRVVAEAELDDLLPVLEFDGGALVVWSRILYTARIRPGAVDGVLRVASKEYPDDPALAQALSLAEAAEPVARAAPRESVTVSVRPDADARPLVDREEIVGRLKTELERMDADRSGHALVLKGDSGVGKTRLADCAARAARERGAVVLEAQCLDASSGPLFPLRDSLKFYRGQPPIEEILGASPGRRDYTRFLESILEVDAVGTAGPHLGGSTVEGVYAGLAEVLLALAADCGLCLVVEDLTDADRDTLRFLDYFRRKAAAERVLTLSTVKEDLVDSELQERIDKWESEGCRVVTVPPLEPEDAVELISCLLEEAKLSKEQMARIVKTTGGNPYFIVQYLELMRDDESFDAEADVPGGIKAVLRRRLRRLDADVRGFLDAASVALDANDRLDVVIHVASVDARTGARLLRRAVEVRCLTQDANGGVKFAQELLRRLVYDGIDQQSRCAMHASAAALLEETGLFTSAAHHYERAEREEDVLRTAREAAERAAHAGLYSTAVQFYELALSIGDVETIGPPLASAYLIVGEWRQAEELLARLPDDSPEVPLLRSELLFVRGSFDRARDEIELALQAPSADRLRTLVRLADIELYLGELPSAAEHARAALAAAHTDAARARCTGIVGAAAFFSGDVEEGERRFIEAMTVVSSQAPEERDPVVYTTLLGNLASVAEIRGQWDAAKQSHEEALAKRREVSDARGVLQSLHAVGRLELALEGFDRALPRLEEARAMAAELGDELECGKIENTFVEVELLRGDPSAAVRRAEAALERFRAANTAYDVTHGRFSLARALVASGERRKAVEEGAAARVGMTRRGFGLLATLFPDLGFAYADRVAAGLLAYACGDALGLPWEGLPPAEIDVDRISAVPAARELPRGATSDDTALTLLVAEELVASPGADGAAFLARLAERAPGIWGLGPSTTAAIEQFRRTGAAPAGGGSTNGALMRSLPIGWAVPLDRVDDRRAWTIELSRTTHPDADACCAALVGAACAAWAIEGADPSLLLDVAMSEAAFAVDSLGADPRIAEILAAIATGRWRSNPEIVGPDPYETLARVLWSVVDESHLEAALLSAVRLGGDTDTVAALVGGLLGCGRTSDQVRAELGWVDEVHAPDAGVLDRLAVGLADLRTGRAGG